MSWLKMTSKSLFLMKGGTDEFLKKVDLQPHGNRANKEFKFDIPTDWGQTGDIPRVMVIDVGSAQDVKESKQTFSASGVFAKVVKRADWSAAPPKSKFETIDHPEFIVIHHTQGTPRRGKAKDVAKDIQAFHMNGNGWSDIGYGFLNMVDGTLIEGREGSLMQAIKGNAVRGAHAGTDRGNRSPSVSNEGNFMVTPMDDKQWQSLVDMCAALCESCDIDPSQIRGHRDFVPTDCPGDWLYARLPQLIKDVAAKLAS
jgi:N-acetylmuramoyl-L-alanine amidase